jgi:4'-phosphopantetheinyl transferase
MVCVTDDLMPSEIVPLEQNSQWEGRHEFAATVDEVHVWMLDLDQLMVDYSILSPGEMGRAARFVRTEDRRRFATAHVAVRQILGRYVNSEPEALNFVGDEFGKPHLIPSGTGITFNLSHSAKYGLLAVAQNRSVGVDIEAMRPLHDLPHMAQQIMSTGEWAAFLPLVSDRGRTKQAHEAFFQLWVRKEAVLKSLGTGFLTDPRAADIGLAPGATCGTWCDTAWSTVPLAARSFAEAAVAVAGKSVAGKCLTLRKFYFGTLRATSAQN